MGEDDPKKNSGVLYWTHRIVSRGSNNVPRAPEQSYRRKMRSAEVLQRFLVSLRSPNFCCADDSAQRLPDREQATSNPLRII